MHYEKAPRFRRSKPDEAPPPLRCAVQGFAPLRRRWGVTGVELRWERAQLENGTLPLEGKTSVGTNDLNPEKVQGLSPELQTALEPWPAGIESLSEQIREYNERIETRAQQSDPQVALLK
jgi:hypothetical protein